MVKMETNTVRPSRPTTRSHRKAFLILQLQQWDVVATTIARKMESLNSSA